MREKLIQWVVWHLPKDLVYWAAMRLIAHATTGQFSNQSVPYLTAIDAVQRWRTSV